MYVLAIVLLLYVFDLDLKTTTNHKVIKKQMIEMIPVSFPVIMESFELDNQSWWKFLDTGPLNRIPLLPV